MTTITLAAIAAGLADVVDFVVARVLDHLGVAQALMPRWGEARPPPSARSLRRDARPLEMHRTAHDARCWVRLPAVADGPPLGDRLNPLPMQKAQ